jgi:hypothetical protein
MKNKSKISIILSQIYKRLNKMQSRHDIVEQYYRNGRIPFGKGYLDARNAYISESLNSYPHFHDLDQLPKEYGYLFDERVIEYPWFFSELKQSYRKSILDIGPCLNYEFTVNKLFDDNSIEEIVFLSLTPDKNCYYSRGISYFLGDSRLLPFKDNYFDLVSCISTLEHIGMDNTKYSGISESSIKDYEIAVIEIKRVLKPGGCLLLTLPFGKYENFGWFQQFDLKMVENVIETFAPKALNTIYYRYSDSGWVISNSTDSALAQYNPSVGYRRNHTFEKGKSVCASSIACIKLIK